MEKHLMPTAKKKSKKSAKKSFTFKKGKPDTWPDLSKDPFVIRKRDQAIALIKEVGLPDDFKTK